MVHKTILLRDYEGLMGPVSLTTAESEGGESALNLPLSAHCGLGEYLCREYNIGMASVVCSR